MAIKNQFTQLKGMTARQKVIAGVFVVVLIFLFWQLRGLFIESPTVPPPVTPPAGSLPPTGSPPTAAAPGAPGAPPPVAGAPTSGIPLSPQQMQPQPAQLPQQEAVSPREAELLRMQQETQAKYLAALNELQMLKIQRELAETNQAIAAARLATITSQKGVIDLLAPPPPPATPPANYAQDLATPTTPSATPSTTPSPPIEQPLTPPRPTAASYTVVSVSQLQYRWNAVLGYQGNLYSVSVGDVLPPDGSKVVAISRSGVVLQKNGERRRISLVPII